MRKNKLIELLQSLEGNPEIVFWNAFVDDYHHIYPEIIEETAVKPTFDTYKSRVEFERQRRLNDFDYKLPDSEISNLKTKYKHIEYEFNEFVDLKYIEEKLYKTKKFYILQAKPRGKSSYDRMGSIQY